jgi:hypothetical protein
MSWHSTGKGLVVKMSLCTVVKGIHPEGFCRHFNVWSIAYTGYKGG